MFKSSLFRNACHLLYSFMMLIFLFIIGFTIIGCDYVEETSFNAEQEYCLNEFFSPKCPRDEVVLIESAKYGRMNIGKCIKEQELMSLGAISKDPKYFGCHIDVTNILHKKCSFKNGCSVEVKDREFNCTTTCHSWVKSHLSVKYQCLNAVPNDKSNCRILTNHKAMHMIIDSTPPNICGNKNNPWILEALRGQKIKITLLKSTKIFEQNPLICSGIGIVIVDPKRAKNTTICQNHVLISGAADDNKMFSSKGGFVEVFNFQSSDISINDESNNKLILKIEADGCTDIIPPEDAWLKRTNDEIIVGCYSSKQTWYLQCEGKKWIGAFGNCSGQDKLRVHDQIVMKPTGSSTSGMSEDNQVLIIMAICSFGIVISLLIMCCGVIIVRRFKSNKAINLVMKEAYLKDDTKVQSVYGPVAYSTLNNRSIGILPNDQATEEQKYFVIDKNIIEK